jgi:hypothetical protein
VEHDGRVGPQDAAAGRYARRVSDREFRNPEEQFILFMRGERVAENELTEGIPGL